MFLFYETVYVQGNGITICTYYLIGMNEYYYLRTLSRAEKSISRVEEYQSQVSWGPLQVSYSIFSHSSCPVKTEKLFIHDVN